MISVDTVVPLLDGRGVTLADIHEEQLETGFLPYVYALDLETRRIVPALLERIERHQELESAVRIELDDGGVILVGKSQQLILLSGSLLGAADLRVGQQLLPLRRRVNVTAKAYRGYEKVYDPGGGTALTHRRVAETLMANELRQTARPNVHHHDRNRLNNDPRNLVVLEFHEHLKEHYTDRFELLTGYTTEHGPWNKGVTKQSDDPRATRLRPTTYDVKFCLNTSCSNVVRVPLHAKRRRYCSVSCAAQHARQGFWTRHRIAVTCQTCATPFTVVAARHAGGRGVYCSKRCMTEGMRDRGQGSGTCQYCGTSITFIRSRPRMFCSRSCSNTYRNKLRAGLIPKLNHRVRAMAASTFSGSVGFALGTSVGNVFLSDRTTGGVLVLAVG